MSVDSSSDRGPLREHGEWPASTESLQYARNFLKDCAQSAKEQRTKTLLLPDKDADGLSASQIIYHTLVMLGHPSDLICVHFVAKGSNIHTENERKKINNHKAQFVIAIDQGSRGGLPLADGQSVRAMVLDHHWSEEFPQDTLVLSAAKYPPVATSAALSYMLCKDLLAVKQSRDKEAYLLERLCVIGTLGDLGATSQFDHLWPKDDIQACIKKFGKKTLTDVVSLVNALRRTSRYDVDSAWNALMNSTLEEIVKPTHTSSAAVKRLHEARAEVKVETAKVSRSPPCFSGNGHIALVRVNSGAQVHPVIATRWANSLKSSKLRIVMCANDGYLPGMTNFSCRVARCALQRQKQASGTSITTQNQGQRKTKLNIGDAGSDALQETANEDDGEVNIIETLVRYAEKDPGLREAMGEDFARGHKQASGGIIRTEYFERLWKVMVESEPTVTDGSPNKKRKKTSEASTQKNTLEGWIKRA